MFTLGAGSRGHDGMRVKDITAENREMYQSIEITRLLSADDAFRLPLSPLHFLFHCESANIITICSEYIAQHMFA